MNAVKRTARKRHYRKNYGAGQEFFADNRNFQRPGMPVASRIPIREHILGQLDARRRAERARHIDFIVKNRDSVDLSIPSGTFVGFHADLSTKSDGEVFALAKLLAVAMKAQGKAND